jgi:hypothetical protein
MIVSASTFRPLPPVKLRERAPNVYLDQAQATASASVLIVCHSCHAMAKFGEAQVAGWGAHRKHPFIYACPECLNK